MPAASLESRPSYHRRMSRWLSPRSSAGRIAAQVLLLILGGAAVYLIVMWMGSYLPGPAGP